jgi:hypothetical protein
MGLLEDAFLDFCNTLAKHDFLLQKSLLLSRPVGRRPAKQGPFARVVFQNSANLRLIILLRDVTKFAPWLGGGGWLVSGVRWAQRERAREPSG